MGRVRRTEKINMTIDHVFDENERIQLQREQLADHFGESELVWDIDDPLNRYQTQAWFTNECYDDVDVDSLEFITRN